MTEVAFHFNADHKLDYACRLIRKAVASQARVAVSADAAQLSQLDRQLWTFAPLEFIPHCMAGAAEASWSPVLLSDDLSRDHQPLLQTQVLLNLGADVPVGFERFERLIEVVTVDESDRLSARQRWRHYAERGYPLVRHDLQGARS